MIDLAVGVPFAIYSYPLVQPPALSSILSSTQIHAPRVQVRCLVS